MKTILTAIMSIFGSAPQPPAPTYDQKEYDEAQEAFFQAQAALKQAQHNMDNATGEYVDAAVYEWNLAFMKSDIATRNLRSMLGLQAPEVKPLEWVTKRASEGSALH